MPSHGPASVCQMDDPRVDPITTVFPAIFVIINLPSVKSLNIATDHVQKNIATDTLMTGNAVYITKVYSWLQEGVQGS